jgi:hypothetical protein
MTESSSNNNIWVPRLQATVHVGTYLMYMDAPVVDVRLANSRPVFVGRVVDCCNGKIKVLKHEYVFSSTGAVRKLTQQRITPICSFPGSLLKEVMELGDAIPRSITVRDVVDYAFVVTPEQLEEHNYVWASGMRNVFVTRFSYAPSTISLQPFVEIEQSLHLPFASMAWSRMSGYCPAKVVWIGLMQMHDAIQRILNLKREDQGEFVKKSQRSPFNLIHSWSYLVKVCKMGGVDVLEKHLTSG